MPATIVEQPLPISVQFLSRISTYAHIFESVLAVVLFWLFPSLRPKMPERLTTFRPRSRRYSESDNSVKSMASTLVDEDVTEREENNESDTDDDEDVKVGKFYMPSTPLMKSKSLSLMPFARRMSLPAKRFSEHISTTISSPFQSPIPSPFGSPLSSPVQTPSSILESTCYFSSPGLSDHVTFEEPEEMVNVVVEQSEEAEYVKDGLLVQPITNSKNNGSVTKMKRATKKAKSLLRLRRQL
ncbi:hypothetical protein BDZ94DRAFT_1303835 [Collybia nuda]|uniref:Uncharacterized protein n=1 Tax=Collybia nuda TaxID=64659 RepID=A0A9P5YK87_9AGAR|nr:hypothetical protein BDZ94DRAFT_1303835 [Collybia nuda]